MCLEINDGGNLSSFIDTCCKSSLGFFMGGSHGLLGGDISEYSLLECLYTVSLAVFLSIEQSEVSLVS